ncbi:MAG: hypothetical protein ACR2RB_10110 [Gammaproteobacteria bacterium]
MKPLWIVKIGGSLVRSPSLRRWLDVIAAVELAKVVVVPGGGPFADTVRDTQRELGFNDEAAHEMALRAMEQYALMVCAFNAAFVPADTQTGVENALRAGRVPVWMPVRMASDRQDIPASWDMTSDALAAWLANKLGATRLVLVKSAGLRGRSISVHELQRTGIVDNYFPVLTRAAPYRIDVVGPNDYARFGKTGLDASPFTEVVTDSRA